jgi:hypothetical protein
MGKPAVGNADGEPAPIAILQSFEAAGAHCIGAEFDELSQITDNESKDRGYQTHKYPYMLQL